MKWNSESRIKSIIHAEGYIPQQQYFKVDLEINIIILLIKI